MVTNIFEGATMILYYMEHLSQVFKLLVHKLSKFADEEAILIVREDSYESEVFRCLEKNKDKFRIRKILSFPKSLIWFGGDDIDVLYENLNKKLDTYFEENDIVLDNFKNIYIMRDSGVSMEIYCLAHRARYVYYETIKNNAAKHIGDHKNAIYTLYNQLLTNINYAATAVQVLTTDKEANKIFYSTWRYFDFIAEFRTLGNEHQRLILNIFNVSDVEKLIQSGELKQATIFAPNSSYDVCVKKGMYARHAMLADELLLDYYFQDDNVFLKSHPLFELILHKDDDLIYSIPHTIPLEVLKVIPGFKFRRLVTVASSAANEVVGYCDEIISLGWEYNSFFMLLHKFTAYFDFLREYCAENHTNLKVVYNGKFYKQLKQLVKYRYHNIFAIDFVSLSALKNVDDKFILIDNINWLELHNRKIDFINLLLIMKTDRSICFISEISDAPFLYFRNRTILGDIITLAIYKTYCRKESNSDIQTESIFIYTKDKQFKEYIDSYYCIKHLPYSGIDIQISRPDCFYQEFINNMFNVVIKEQALDNLIYLTYSRNNSQYILFNPMFIFGFRKEKMQLGAGFQEMCYGWNTHTSEQGSFLTEKLAEGVSITVQSAGRWNNLEQWIDSNNLFNKGNKFVVVLDFIVGGKDVSSIYVAEYYNNKSKRIFRQKLKMETDKQKFISDPFIIQNKAASKFIVGISLHAKDGVKCAIRYFDIKSI